ncbi:MAG: tyrosine-type recombinase/integrase [Bacteroidota bacterium]
MFLAMVIQNGNIQFLDKDSQDLLLSRCGENLRYRFLILLMMRCGLRITETLRLQWKDFDFQQKIVKVYSLKKRESARKRERIIPITSEVLECAADYWKKMRPESQEELLFKGLSQKGHLTRQAVDLKLKALMSGISAHKLRHTFATEQIAQGTDLIVVRELLGHNDIRTTQIYTHIPRERLELAMKYTERHRTSFFTRLRQRYFPSKKVHLLPLNEGITNFHIGRKEEMQLLHDLIKKRVNVLLLGEQGIGKSHLLDNLTIEKCLRLDEFSSVKKTTAGMLLMLKNGDKESILELLTQGKKFDQYVNRENTRALIELMIQITQPKEYTILIDDVSRITAAGISAMEKLKNHFHLIVAARSIKIDKATFLTNFQKIELQPLTRAESIEMIDLLSRDIRRKIENYELFKTHLYNQTNGNPLFLIEMIQRYAVEPEITIEVIRQIGHTSALRDIDMTLVFVVGLSTLMILRYVGGEFGSDAGAFRLIGGAAMIFALFARYFYSASKRKYI